MAGALRANLDREGVVISPALSAIAISGTLRGFPNPPAMSFARRSRAALDAIVISGTLRGFPNPPAMSFARRSRAALDAIVRVAVVAFVAASSQVRAAPPRVELVERVTEDACDRARAFDIADQGAEAQHARRLCRLQQFEHRLAAERRQEVAAELQARDARLAAWLDSKQPTRALRPLAIEGFAGSGVMTYGLAVTWMVLSRLELAGRIGWRNMTCANEFSNNGADCTRQGLGLGARWFLGSHDFGPFLGAGLTMSESHLQVATSTPEMGFTLLKGDGRAHSAGGSAGMHLAYRGLRLSLEYIYEHVYFTGANLEDPQKTPSEPLRVIWRDSLKQDRHGLRFQAGYAF
jgi:hypothetical protein